MLLPFSLCRHHSNFTRNVAATSGSGGGVLLTFLGAYVHTVLAYGICAAALPASPTLALAPAMHLLVLASVLTHLTPRAPALHLSTHSFACPPDPLNPCRPVHGPTHGGHRLPLLRQPGRPPRRRPRLTSRVRHTPHRPAQHLHQRRRPATVRRLSYSRRRRLALCVSADCAERERVPGEPGCGAGGRCVRVVGGARLGACHGRNVGPLPARPPGAAAVAVLAGECLRLRTLLELGKLSLLSVINVVDPESHAPNDLNYGRVPGNGCTRRHGQTERCVCRTAGCGAGRKYGWHRRRRPSCQQPYCGRPRRGRRT